VTPAQLIARMKKQGLPPAVLLLGPEAYERRRLKQAMAATVPPEALTEHDLGDVSLAEVVDDARSLSLFASERLIWVTNAEAALPRGRGSDDDGEGE
jgi:DNA polymerase-3 subunit delta